MKTKYLETGEPVYSADEVEEQLESLRSEITHWKGGYEAANDTIAELSEKLTEYRELITERESVIKNLCDSHVAKDKEIKELRAFLKEMVDNSNFLGCNHTIPTHWRDKAKSLIL